MATTTLGGKAGRPPPQGIQNRREAVERLLRFARTGQLQRRTKAAENALLAELTHVFGSRRTRNFSQRVWPGVEDFRLARPMQSVQQVASN